MYCPENCSVGHASVSRAFLNATVSRAAAVSRAATESRARRPEKKVQEKFLEAEAGQTKYPEEAKNEKTVAETNTVALSDRKVVATSGYGTRNPVLRLVQTSFAGKIQGAVPEGSKKPGTQRHCDCEE